MDLPLKHIMAIPQGTISVIRTVIVELEQDGLRGYGEAYEDPNFGITVENMVLALEHCRQHLGCYALADPIAFYYHIYPDLKNNPAALCALEMAGYDLWGKLRNYPLWQTWSFNMQHVPLSSYTLGLDSPYRVIEKFHECPDWPIYRIKLGSRHDMTILRELRKRTKSPFRLDINGNWTLEQTLDVMDELVTLNVELLEQPLRQDDWEGMKVLKEKSPIPILADESCRCDQDIDRCADYFHGINLKPVKFGGLTPTLEAIKKTKRLGLKTLIGNTIESSVGASAMSQFAPNLDYIYIDGPLLINKKIGKGVQLDRGKIIFSPENGTGIRFQFIRG